MLDNITKNSNNSVGEELEKIGNKPLMMTFIRMLAVVSVLVVTSVMVTTSYCIVSDTYTPFHGSAVPPRLRDVLMAYGILAFQFDIHPMLLTIQVDMKDSSKIGYAVIGGFLVTGTFFALTTFLAALRYGKNIMPNILQGLPASFPLYFVVLLVTVQLCLSSAVGSSALFQHIEDFLGISRDFGVKRCGVRALVVALGVFLGEAVPRFDLVMGLVGSSLTGPLMFVLPPLLYARVLQLRGAPGPRFKADFLLAFLVMCFGVLATIVATIHSWSDAIAYAQFTPPCLFNFTAASNSLQI